MRLEPLGDMIIVRPDVAEEKVRESGLVIAAAQQERPLLGEVVAIGPEVVNVESGDRVVFGRYSGQEMAYDDTKYLLLKSREVYARENAL